MSAYLDIIILLFVVVMVFAKLKNLLGTRPENETEISKESAAKIFDILMQEHNKRHPQAEKGGEELKADESGLSESEKNLRAIPGFNRDKFLNGAKKPLKSSSPRLPRATSTRWKTLSAKRF